MSQNTVSRRFEQIRSGQTNTSKTSRRPAPRGMPSEFLCELQSAASMIMSRAECEELEREMQALRKPRMVAA